MAMQRIGSCSLCGGDVMAWEGGWHAVTPPPPPTCSQCGAGTATDVIPMVPRGHRPFPQRQPFGGLTVDETGGAS